MPIMRKSSETNNPVAAIACADIHLSHTPPIARAGEPNWYETMKRTLMELENLKRRHGVPILCAGDIFHHWKSPPELINFALDYLPEMIAIPGQHDLPNHVLADVDKSAFGTLEKAGKIVCHRYSMGGVIYNEFNDGDYLRLSLFPWGSTVQPPTIKKGTGINVCLHHAYRWVKDKRYLGAPAESQFSTSEYKGYDVVIIGDNHISWDAQLCRIGELRNVSNPFQSVFNCGSLMRRNSDQINHRPRVGLIHLDGSVESHYLDCSKDIISATAGPLERASETPISLARLQEQLKQLQGSTLDFIAVLRQTMDREGITPEVQQIIEEAIEGKQ
jgi:calcineurin-like phosphoesterase family protein